MVFRQSWKHLSSSLWVPYVWNFIKIRLLPNSVYHSWQIVLAELPKAIIEEVSLSNLAGISSAVNISSVISNPHVEPRIDQLKRQRFLATTNKALCAGEYSMLQQNRFIYTADPIINWRNPKHFKYIAIFCCHSIALTSIFSTFLYQLPKSLIFILNYFLFRIQSRFSLKHFWKPFGCVRYVFIVNLACVWHVGLEIGHVWDAWGNVGFDAEGVGHLVVDLLELLG